MQVNYKRIISCCIVLGFLIVTTRPWGADYFPKRKHSNNRLQFTREAVRFIVKALQPQSPFGM